MTTWENADGIQVRFGQYHSEDANWVNRPRSLNTDGAIKEIEVDFDLAYTADGVTSFTSDLNNNGTKNGYKEGIDAKIPANSAIIEAHIVVSEAAAGGTNVDFGLHEADGTVIDVDGIDVDVLTATLSLGAYVACNGALVGAGIGTADGYVSLTPAGTFTAGKGRLIVRYIEPAADA